MGSSGFLSNANLESGDSVKGFLDFHNGFRLGSNGFLCNANPESNDSVRGFLDFHNGSLSGSNGSLFNANPNSGDSVREVLDLHNGQKRSISGYVYSCMADLAICGTGCNIVLEAEFGKRLASQLPNQLLKKSRQN